MEEDDEENYLAILSDSADHCVTRKVCGHYGNMSYTVQAQTSLVHTGPLECSLQL